MNTNSRRQFIAGVGIVGAGILAAGCTKKGADKEVTAVEDLMREHGVLRRALLVYKETAPRLRENPTPAIAEAVQKTAQLFRSFGEEYHEKALEEKHIFPLLGKTDPGVSALASTLVAQHERGRQVTEYLLAVTQQGKIENSKGVEIAQVLESFVVMYQNHAAREDTVIFPAWKQAVPAGQLDELSDRFEDIERAQFGKDGFEKAVSRIAEIETALGLADIGQFTVQPPPRA